MKIIVFLLFITLTVVEQIMAESYCAVESILDDRVNGRANQIRFPDGRLLSVVGHTHGERDMLINQQQKDFLKKISN